MFENEEEKLAELRRQLEHISIPTEQLDGAIGQGYERAKLEKVKKKKRKIRNYGMLAATALLMITLATFIRVSPTFANAVSSIPGLEKIVAMIHYDKGLTSAIKNDYYQEINASQTKEDLTLTIDGVILDESGMNVFYTVNSEEAIQNVRVGNVELRNDEIISPSSSFSISANDQAVKELSNTIDFHFQKPTKFNDLSFSLVMTIENEGKEIEYIIPFTVPENVKPSINFVLKKEVEIENQKFTIEEVTINPRRVDVRISINPNNSKKILQFPDLRLEDENGEIWGSRSGISGSEVGELEQIIYVQSNYFEKPKELYLRINKLQALNKDEAIVVVDTEKNILLNSPRDGRLQLGESSKTHADFFLTQAKDVNNNFSLTSIIQDANGKSISSPSTSMFYDSGKLESHWTLDFDTTDYKNPLELELLAYPNYIEGDIKVELKKPNK